MNIFFLFHLCLLFLKKIKIEKLFLLTFCLKLRMRQMLIQKKKCVGKSYFWVSADTAAAELWTLQRFFFCRNSVCGIKIWEWKWRPVERANRRKVTELNWGFSETKYRFSVTKLFPLYFPSRTCSVPFGTPPWVSTSFILLRGFASVGLLCWYKALYRPNLPYPSLGNFFQSYDLWSTHAGYIGFQKS